MYDYSGGRLRFDGSKVETFPQCVPSMRQALFRESSGQHVCLTSERSLVRSLVATKKFFPWFLFIHFFSLFYCVIYLLILS